MTGSWNEMSATAIEEAQTRVEAYMRRNYSILCRLVTSVDDAAVQLRPTPQDALLIDRLMREARETIDAQNREWLTLNSHECLVCLGVPRNAVSLPPCKDCNQAPLPSLDRITTRYKGRSVRMVCCKECIDAYFELHKRPQERKALVKHFVCSAMYTPQKMKSGPGGIGQIEPYQVETRIK